MKLSKEFKVGALALASLIAFYLGVNFLRGIDFFSSSNTYYVIYDDIGGLTVSNPVLINGFSVGRVNNIKILQERKNQMLIEMDIAKDIVIGEGTNAVLINSDLLGSKAINLEIGNVSRPLEKGDTLNGKVDEGLAQLLREKSVPIADNLSEITEKLSVFLDNMNKDDGTLNQTLQEIKVATEQLNYTISENRRNIRRLTKNMADVSDTFNDKEKGVEPLISNMNALVDSLQAMNLEETSQRLNETLASLNQTLEGVNSGEGTLGKLAKDDSLYHNLNASAAALSVLLEDLEENPKRYVHFSVFGRKDKKDEDEEEKNDSENMMQ